ncbi:ArsR family transcriptional regulator [Macrococcus brunensis]|uniref:ArsR family transcriptional regulator n=1 Tax=Macrococcus brunensis TaxID=198483 RepID=A0A4R6BAU2_9STAP|nr:helix-turn-helix domain-containing protein [Macrococcus brunensis]TDL93428.1 ArsR family transcriptional regulator [Macrococcus brunensis]ULG72363.1 helix-turn-helix domain-containing protein [Macrococcus brunensis]ULG74624.1 helix-turn-helix domain-containing protein [Macrococcus brunensis]
MQDFLLIDNLAQLKCISDPFRIKLLECLYDTSKTGQQLADELEIPRAKIHYHLREMEKYGFIEIVKTEQKISIIQKFYAPTAKAFIPAEHLLQFHTDEASAKQDTEKSGKELKVQIDEKELPQLKKDLKKFLKKASSKSGDTHYEVHIETVKK